MTDKPKIDLSNVGGHPKDWLDQDNSDGAWLGDLTMVVKIVLPILLLLGCAGLFVMKVFEYASRI